MSFSESQSQSQSQFLMTVCIYLHDGFVCFYELEISESYPTYEPGDLVEVVRRFGCEREAAVVLGCGSMFPVLLLWLFYNLYTQCITLIMGLSFSASQDEAEEGAKFYWREISKLHNTSLQPSFFGHSFEAIKELSQVDLGFDSDDVSILK